MRWWTVSTTCHSNKCSNNSNNNQWWACSHPCSQTFSSLSNSRLSLTNSSPSNLKTELFKDLWHHRPLNGRSSHSKNLIAFTPLNPQNKMLSSSKLMSKLPTTRTNRLTSKTEVADNSSLQALISRRISRWVIGQASSSNLPLEHQLTLTASNHHGPRQANNNIPACQWKPQTLATWDKPWLRSRTKRTNSNRRWGQVVMKIWRPNLRSSTTTSKP